MNISNKNIKANHSSSKSCLLFVFTVFIITIALLISGCTIPGITNPPPEQTEPVSQETADDQQSKDTASAEETGSSETTGENTAGTEPEETTGDTAAGSGEIAINIYYSDATAQYLIGETRIIPKENKYIEAIYEMMKEPTDPGLIRLIPDTTKINDIKVEGGLAKVDFSSHFVDDRFQGDAADILLIFSVVNTLTEFDEINSVEFYINGERLDLIGMLDLADPQFRRSDLIKEG